METVKIGEKLKLLRELHGFSQEDIAKKINISQNTYSRIETGESEITLKRLEDLAKVYKLKITDLLNFDTKYTQIVHHNASVAALIYNSNNFGEKERELYERHIEQLKEENKFLKESIEHLRKLIPNS